jgi:hypothetical protein
MAYDASKDVTLAEIENEDLGLCVHASQYNGGEVKVGIQRFYIKNGERKWSKLGRLTLREAGFVNASIADLMDRPEVQSATSKAA